MNECVCFLLMVWFIMSMLLADSFSQWDVLISKGSLESLDCRGWNSLQILNIVRLIGWGGGGRVRMHHPQDMWMYCLITINALTLTTPNPPKSFSWFCLILPDFDGFSTPQYSPANRACSHVYQIHQTPPAAFVGFSTPQYSPANRACSHVYQIHQTPPAAFVGFRTPQYSPANRACSHVYQIHQTPPAAFVGFRTVYIAKPRMLCICYCTKSINCPKGSTIGVPFYCMLMDFGGFGMGPS